MLYKVKLYKALVSSSFYLLLKFTLFPTRNLNALISLLNITGKSKI